MNYPKCPHCKYEFDADDIWLDSKIDFPTESDGDTNDTHCPSCKEPLRVMLELTPSWTFLDENDDEIAA